MNSKRLESMQRANDAELEKVRTACETLTPYFQILVQKEAFSKEILVALLSIPQIVLLSQAAEMKTAKETRHNRG